MFAFIGFLDIIGFLWSLYSHAIFIWCIVLKLVSIYWINPKKIKGSREEYVTLVCFRFWPMKNIFLKLQANESLIMACLQIYREVLPLAIFLPSSFRLKRGILPLLTKYLSYSEEMHILKTTCHIKLRFFLWTKLLEKLLLVKYLIFVAANLILLKKRHFSTFQNKSSETSRIQIAEKLFHFFFLCNQVKTFLLSICPWIIILIKLYVFKKTVVNTCSYNPVQNILIKIKKWSRVRQVRLWHFFFRIFCVPVPKTHFYREDLTLGSIPHTVLKIFLCFLFSIILRLTSFSNFWVDSYIVLYTRYQVTFYFWWMEPIQNFVKFQILWTGLSKKFAFATYIFKSD